MRICKTAPSSAAREVTSPSDNPRRYKWIEASDALTYRLKCPDASDVTDLHENACPETPAYGICEPKQDPVFESQLDGTVRAPKPANKAA